MPRDIKPWTEATQADASASGMSSHAGQTYSADNSGRFLRVARRCAANPAVVSATVLVAVVAVVLATYWPALSAGARYMDDKFYLGAPLLRHPSWTSLKTIFAGVLTPSVVGGYYHPLTLLSVMLDFLDPTAANSLLPFHRTTLSLHLLNTALVVVFLHLLFGNWLTAGLLGLLYGLHPLNVDAVLWIAERKTVLSTCFALWSLILYVTYARHLERAGRGDWKRYLASLIMYACALLSKPTALPLVGLLLVLDYWPLKRRFSRVTLLEKLPFLIVGVLFAVLSVISQARTVDDGGVQLMNPLYVPLVAGYSFVLYLVKTIWPVGLLSDYPCPEPFGLTNINVLASVFCMAGVIAAIVFSVRRTRAWTAGGLFFLVAILPTLGIIRYTSSIAANRSMYLPMVGLLLPLSWGLNRLWKMDFGVLKASRVRLILVGAGVILAAGSAVATRSYESRWSDTLTLLQYYLTQAPTEWKLHTRLGNEWIERRNYQLAIDEFREAVRLNPYWGENHLNLGRALFTVGQYAEAKQAFAMAVQRTPMDWRTHMLMGTTLTRQEDLEGALREFRIAAQLAPAKAAAPYEMGNVLAQQGKLDEAVKAYRQALRLDPRFEAAQRELEAVASRQR